MKKYTLISSIFIGGLIIGAFIQPLVSGDNIYEQIKKYEYILNMAYKNYVEDVDINKLTESAIKGMLNELDVHSVYIPAEQMKKVDEDFEGSFEGVGIEYEVLDDTIIVVSPIPGGPSEQVGIQANDKIITVDGKNVTGLEQNEVPKLLRGTKGTAVEMSIMRKNNPELLNFRIIRDRIPNYSVVGYHIIDGTDIGYIKIERFAQTTYEELITAAIGLKKQGMKKLILDFRGNPGGLYDQAVDMVQEFLPRGDTIVYTKGRKPDDVAYSVSVKNGEYRDLPLIILIDEGSASASEIFSGAIQDLDRGLIVGETSYGKGLVQRQYKTGDGSAFRITIAKYYTPSGRCIQRPYKDKEDYRNLAGRFELEEGSNLDITIEKLKKSIDPEKESFSIENGYVLIRHNNKDGKKNKSDMSRVDSLQIFHTKSGRIVLGGGGITPDYYVKSDTITVLTRELRTNNLFFEYVNSLMNSQGEKLRDTYSQNFNQFLRSFNITQEMSGEFRKYTESKGIKWNDDDYKKDKEYIDIYLKANIARSIWDRNKFLVVFYTTDKTIKSAKQLFPTATKIANLR
jgi:carboxyl-terminal processing protease